jgi:LEA14-like dessication related protein
VTEKMASRKIIALAAILIVIVAFASLGVYYYDAYHKLTFQLSNVNLTNLSLSSLQMNLGIEISNPSSLPLYIPSGDFEIYLNNQNLGKGTFGSTTIGGNSQNMIVVPLTFSTSDLPSVLYGILTGGGNVTVSIQGSANLGLFRIPFNSTLYNASFK